jgi:hypothetical protein
LNAFVLGISLLAAPAAPVNAVATRAQTDVAAGLDAYQRGDVVRAIDAYTRAISSGELAGAELGTTYRQRGDAQMAKAA